MKKARLLSLAGFLFAPRVRYMKMEYMAAISASQAPISIPDSLS